MFVRVVYHDSLDFRVAESQTVVPAMCEALEWVFTKRQERPALHVKVFIEDRSYTGRGEMGPACMDTLGLDELNLAWEYTPGKVSDEYQDDPWEEDYLPLTVS